MRERYHQILRLVCIGLAVILLVQVFRIVLNRNPVARLQIPEVPTLTKSETEGGSKATNAVSAKGSSKNSTNLVVSGPAPKETNTTSATRVTQNATNTTTAKIVQTPATNLPGPLELAKHPTNAVPPPAAAKTASNVVAQAGSGKSATNLLAHAETVSTNKPAGPAPQVGGPPPGMPPGMPGMMGPGMPGKAPDLPPEVWARVDRIVDSEILGPVMRPLPMALMGIVGNIAFLRASNGQTGLVKEGENLGDLKLLRIGINRVLVEESGEKKELMIYSGMGGESLLPK